MERSYSYEDPYLLNSLLFSAGDTCGFDAILKPNFPDIVGSDFGTEVKRRLLVEANAFDSDELALLEEFDFCTSNGIVPFFYAEYSDTFGRIKDFPEVKWGHELSYSVGIDSERKVAFRQKMREIASNFFTSHEKTLWKYVVFESVNDASDVAKGKDKIARLIHQDPGYYLSRLTLRLKPHEVSCGYQGGNYRIESEATLFAGRGRIRVKGDVSEDFDPTQFSASVPQPESVSFDTLSQHLIRND